MRIKRVFGYGIKFGVLLRTIIQQLAIEYGILRCVSCGFISSEIVIAALGYRVIKRQIQLSEKQKRTLAWLKKATVSVQV